ncbi:MAG: hypothetical protein WCK29_04775 [archaeon]
MKVLIFDSGALINLSMNGLLYILPELKKNFDGKFIVTSQVRYETVDRPIGIEKFELGAIMVQNLIDEGVLDDIGTLDITEEQVKEGTKRLMDEANHAMKIKNDWVHLVEEGEMSCLAVSNILDERKIENIIAIDERTTRMLGENPGNLERIMSEKLHQRVQIVASNLDSFENVRFIRSSELVFVAYKKGIIKLEGKQVLEALLYATKFKGSSISFDEINVLKKE